VTSVVPVVSWHWESVVLIATSQLSS
jgi:hypothetical protein